MDRILHGGPYSVDNVRIVLHCVNTFRGRLDDDQMLIIAREMVKKAKRDGDKAVRVGPAKKTLYCGVQPSIFASSVIPEHLLPAPGILANSEHTPVP
jgi:hypothetical protein